MKVDNIKIIARSVEGEQFEIVVDGLAEIDIDVREESDWGSLRVVPGFEMQALRAKIDVELRGLYSKMTVRRINP